MSDVRDSTGRIAKPAIDAKGRRFIPVEMREATAEELRRFRFVSVNKSRNHVYAYTTDPEVVQGYESTYYKRAKDVTEYEVVFGPRAVDAALEVMKERGQL